MPHGTKKIELDTPIEHVWTFVSDINQWAPLVPGYIDHTIIHDHQSTWTFNGEVGKIQKTIHLRIDITEWREPECVKFTLTGLSDNLKGDGYFEAQSFGHNKTQITSYIRVVAKGVKGTLINPVLKSVVPKITKELTNAMADKLKKRHKAYV